MKRAPRRRARHDDQAHVLSRSEARQFLVSHLQLAHPSKRRGASGIRALLKTLRCIQLDPLDTIGTNADLVVLARVDGVSKGDVYQALLPGHAFEHFAKERCLLPAHAFPHYRDRSVETPWWRLARRRERCPAQVVDTVLEEIRRRGPATARELTDHGSVEPLNWSGWKGTNRMTSMALEILWTQCRIVVCGRTPEGDKRYAAPERALPRVAAQPTSEPFERWAIIERTWAAGLLRTAGGPQWSMLKDARTSDLARELVNEGILQTIRIEGSRRTYLARSDALTKRVRPPDDRMRILGPLDPLLWDRDLVRSAFGFDYVWEVYKPEDKRRWGWYVCPLLHRGELVGRIEARLDDDVLRVTRFWEESVGSVDRSALDDALERHRTALGANQCRRPKRPTRLPSTQTNRREQLP